MDRLIFVGTWAVAFILTVMYWQTILGVSFWGTRFFKTFINLTPVKPLTHNVSKKTYINNFTAF